MAASVLPFLAALRKGIPDFSGMTSDDGTADVNANIAAPSVIPTNPQMLPSPQGPPAPPGPAPDPTPDLTLGGSQQPAQPPQDPMQAIAQSMTAGDQKPTLQGETKGHKLMRILLGAAYGGLMGQAQNAQTYAATGRNAGFGGGVAGALQMPLQLQHQQLENQQIAQLLPFLRAQQFAGLQKTSSEAQKNLAEAGKATAETGAVSSKTALEAAQTEAANYKDDPNLGLIDLRTGRPVAGNAGMAPLNADEAAILGKQPGENVPLKLKNTANEMVNRGIRSVTANGRSLLVDSKGNTVKDMGVATPLAVINAQMAAPPTTASGALSDPNMEIVANAVAGGKEDMATALRPYMRFPGKANALEARVLQINPDYYQGDYQNRLKVLEKATQGSWADQKIAFNTMIQHAELLRQAAKELNNGNFRALADLSNRAQSQFGDPALTNFDAISNAYNHEVTSVIGKGHVTDTEVKTGGATMPASANYATIDKVLGSYESLAKSKMGFLQKQIDAGMKGTKGLDDTNQPQGGGISVTAPDGSVHTFKDQASADKFKKLAGIK